MSHACPPEHERWLVAALADGPEALDAAERHALEQCPRCAAEWAELRDVRATLEQTAGAEREDLATAKRTAGQAEERFVRAALGPRIVPVRRRRVITALLVATLAAAAVLVLFLRHGGGAEPQHTPEVLLGRTVRLVVPADERLPGKLQWNDTEPDRYGYRLRIWPADGSEEESLLLDLPVKGISFDLDTQAIATWPPRVWVRIVAVDGARGELEGIGDLRELSLSR